MKIIHRVVASLFSLLQTNLFFVFQMLLQVSAKRTNVPGLKQFRPRRVGFRSRSTHMPPYLCPYGYGYVSLILPTLIINQRRRFHRYFSWLTCKTQMVKTIMDYSYHFRKVPRFRMPMRYNPYYWSFSFGHEVWLVDDKWNGCIRKISSPSTFLCLDDHRLGETGLKDIYG